MEIIKNGFKNEKLEIELDVYIIEGKEWFKAQDISEYLGYRDTDKMTRNIDNIDKNSCTHIMGTAQNNKYYATFINEFALYEAILKIRKSDLSRYEKARNFQEWIFEEVLPSIRKNNYYVDKENITESQLDKLKEYLFDLCDIGKISLGKASKKIFGNEKELKNRLINLGFIDYEKNTFVQKRFTASNNKEYDLFVCNMSGSYEDGIASHNLQVSITNAGFVWLKNNFDKNKDLGLNIGDDK